MTAQQAKWIVHKNKMDRAEAKINQQATPTE
jgi:hypothetical protein